MWGLVSEDEESVSSIGDYKDDKIDSDLEERLYSEVYHKYVGDNIEKISVPESVEIVNPVKNSPNNGRTNHSTPCTSPWNNSGTKVLSVPSSAKTQKKSKSPNEARKENNTSGFDDFSFLRLIKRTKSPSSVQKKDAEKTIPVEVLKGLKKTNAKHRLKVFATVSSDSEEAESIVNAKGHASKGKSSSILNTSSQMLDDESETLPDSDVVELSSDESVNIFGNHSSEETDIKLNLEVNCDIAQKSASSTGHLWKLDVADRFNYRPINRYHSLNPNAFCKNCKERGHLAHMCDKPRKVMCFACGSEGHFEYKCIEQYCTRCLQSGHTVRRCPVSERELIGPCTICNMPGHLSEVCPDLWRRFHLTTTSQEIVCGKKRIKPYRSRYCYNCAMQGHFGHECRRRGSGWYPTTPYIASYKNPFVPPVKKQNASKSTIIWNSSHKARIDMYNLCITLERMKFSPRQ